MATEVIPNSHTRISRNVGVNMIIQVGASSSPTLLLLWLLSYGAIAGQPGNGIIVCRV